MPRFKEQKIEENEEVISTPTTQFNHVESSNNEKNKLSAAFKSTTTRIPKEKQKAPDLGKYDVKSFVEENMEALKKKKLS